MRAQEALCIFLRRIAADLWPAGDAILGNGAVSKNAAGAAQRHTGCALRSATNISLREAADITVAAAPAIRQLPQYLPYQSAWCTARSASDIVRLSLTRGVTPAVGARILHTSPPANLSQSRGKKKKMASDKAVSRSSIKAVGPPEAETPQQVPRLVQPISKARPNLDIETLGADLPTFDELMNQKKPAKGEKPAAASISSAERTSVLSKTRKFASSADVQDQALALYVNSQLYSVAAAEFRKRLLKGMNMPLIDALLAATDEEAVAELLFPYFAEFVLHTYPEDIASYRTLVQTVDLTKPHLWYPMARSLRRRIIYHAGPTNSGKTYQALQAMRAADNGVYCAPLRLLAMEVADACNMDGTFCTLITGQERKHVPGATHTACTIEMANLTRRVDVAVIDEIQMVGDEQRGWAWTRALQGLPANELHLCGDGSALPLVRQLCEAMGEEVEVANYERFTPLAVETAGLRGGYKSVQPGDCIVAFSRKTIFAIKQTIEAETGQKVCVVYGALPPEMRRLQARLFNEPDTEYKILVASDAVGMGLNLNIRRIIFHSVSKFEGHPEAVPVSVSQLKQIAGRAGRRSSEWSQGLATCFRRRDVAALEAALAVPLADMSTPHAGLFPEFEHLEVFAGQVPELSFHELLVKFGEEARMDGTYFFCKMESVLEIARNLETVQDLSLSDRFTFAMAPCNSRDQTATSCLKAWASKYANNEAAPFSLKCPTRTPESSDELKQMERLYQVASLWMWLSLRFGEESFPGRPDATEALAQMVVLMEDGLQALSTEQAAAMTATSERSSQKDGPKRKHGVTTHEKPAASSPPDKRRSQGSQVQLTASSQLPPPPPLCSPLLPAGVNGRSMWEDNSEIVAPPVVAGSASRRLSSEASTPASSFAAAQAPDDCDSSSDNSSDQHPAYRGNASTGAQDGLWARIKGAGSALPQNLPHVLDGSYNRDQAFTATAFPPRRVHHRRLLALPCDDAAEKLPLDALRRGSVVTKAPRPFGGQRADLLIASAVAASQGASGATQVERELEKESCHGSPQPRSALSRYPPVASSVSDMWSNPPVRRSATQKSPRRGAVLRRQAEQPY